LITDALPTEQLGQTGAGRVLLDGKFAADEENTNVVPRSPGYSTKKSESCSVFSNCSISSKTTFV